MLECRHPFPGQATGREEQATPAEALDGRSARLRGPAPGSLHANYHVVAVKA